MSLFDETMRKQDALNRDLIRSTKNGSKGFDSLPTFSLRDSCLSGTGFEHLWEPRPGIRTAPDPYADRVVANFMNRTFGRS